jgi:hypothetical protein
MIVIDHEQMRAALRDAARYRVVREHWFLQENLDWYDGAEAFDAWLDTLISTADEATGGKR